MNNLISRLKIKTRSSIKKLIENKYTLVYFFLFWFFLFLTLSFFRDSRLDENIYIADSVEISNILRGGEWVGNYGIGLHGFLNKLFLGIVFLFTGPSVFLATLVNILFATFSGVIFYKILLKGLSFSKEYALLGVILLFSSYQFLLNAPTFYRDIPALFFLLLTLYSILRKKNKWLVGLFLLLLLDSKEHVFYTVAPAFVIWLFIESWINNKKNLFGWIKESIFSGIKIFLPSLVFLFLMFCTSVVPLNIYNANILGLIDEGLAPMISNFDLEMSTENRDAAINAGLAKIMPTISAQNIDSTVVSYLVSFINTILSYIGKIFYPRTFSFLSIPFIILVPSVIFSLSFFINSLRQKENEKLILPLILFVYLAIYILHASISRYLLPISPVIFLFFLMLLRDFSFQQVNKKRILIMTFLFILGGLYFEYSFLFTKIGINIILFSILFLLFFYVKFNKKILKILFILILSVFTFCTSLLASYLHGQIGGYRTYGYNRECEKIVSLVDREEKVLINDINWDKLPFLLRKENLGNSEWRWSLKPWVPKKDLLIERKDIRTYNFYWSNIEDLREKIIANKIEKVLYIKLEIVKEEELLLQDRLDLLLNTEWLQLVEKQGMKNKEIYLFNIDKSVHD